MLEDVVVAGYRPGDDHVAVLTYDGQDRRRLLHCPGDDLNACPGVVAAVLSGVSVSAIMDAPIGHIHTGATDIGDAAIIRSADRRIAAGNVRWIAAQIEVARTIGEGWQAIWGKFEWEGAGDVCGRFRGNN